MKPVSISTAKEIAKAVGAHGVAIFVFDGEHVGATSYGADKDKCALMGKWIDGIVDGIEASTIPEPFGNGCPWPRIMQE
jgi:hypothetical protein